MELQLWSYMWVGSQEVASLVSICMHEQQEAKRRCTQLHASKVRSRSTLQRDAVAELQLWSYMWVGSQEVASLVLRYLSSLGFGLDLFDRGRWRKLKRSASAAPRRDQAPRSSRDEADAAPCHWVGSQEVASLVLRYLSSLGFGLDLFDDLVSRIRTTMAQTEALSIRSTPPRSSAAILSR
jgi:hypothetical protein